MAGPTWPRKTRGNRGASSTAFLFRHHNPLNFTSSSPRPPFDPSGDWSSPSRLLICECLRLSQTPGGAHTDIPCTCFAFLDGALAKHPEAAVSGTKFIPSATSAFIPESFFRKSLDLFQITFSQPHLVVRIASHLDKMATTAMDYEPTGDRFEGSFAPLCPSSTDGAILAFCHLGIIAATR